MARSSATTLPATTQRCCGMTRTGKPQPLMGITNNRMTKCKIYTIQELIDTGLPIFDGHRAADTKIGEKYITDTVISRWDFTDHSEHYRFFTRVGETVIEHVVQISMRTGEATGRVEWLKKDLSNLDTDFGVERPPRTNAPTSPLEG